MSEEKKGRSLFRVAIESGLFPASWTRRLGGYAFSKAAEFSGVRPDEAPLDLVERIKSEAPLNEARVAQSLLEIADMTDPDGAGSSAEARDLRAKRRGYRVYGHSKIVKAVLQADADPSVPPVIEQQVVDIAKESGTDPARLDAVLSEHEQRRAQRILEP